MASLDLSDLLAGSNENLSVEFKTWMDPRQNEVRAKLARHIAALANHGGGYIVFGVDDTTRKPLRNTELDLSLFSQDAISSIIKKYLEPRLQILVEHIIFEGETYPVVVVPSHGARPIIAIADGPQDSRGKSTGIQQGALYIRAAGPESVQIRNVDDWNSLLDRCLSHRSDLLGNVLRQSLARQSRPDSNVIGILRAAIEDTAKDFTAQTHLLAEKVDTKYRDGVIRAGNNYSALGYALVDSSGNHIEIKNPRATNDRVSIEMHRHANYGWNSFLPLHVPERAPQIRMSVIDGRDVSYLEGMRVENAGLIGGSFDYWRLYECGMGISVESFRDDWRRENEDLPAHLTPGWILITIHSLLAHARLVGQDVPGAAQIIVRMEWKGLKGRMLLWDRLRYAAGGAALADDRFAKDFVIDWAILRDDYFEGLRLIALPFLQIFGSSGWFDPDKWLTREAVKSQFTQHRMSTLKLFDDE